MRYFLENETLKIEVDSFGGELKSVVRKDNNREYMWWGNKKYWARTSPVLFPIVGSLRDKKFTWEGAEYPMGQHGFARDTELTLESQTEDEIWFTLKSSEETLKKYPFEFVLSLGYRLKGDKVDVLWKVENPADKEMYFSIGAHPAFLCPANGEANKTGYKVSFEKAGQALSEIHYHGITGDTGLSLEEDIVLNLDGGRSTITDDYFDRCAYLVEGRQADKVSILTSDNKPVVSVSFDTPLFAVWSPEKKQAPFICIEPWFGRCDAVDFDGDFSQRKYVQKLNANTSFVAGYNVEFHKM